MFFEQPLLLALGALAMGIALGRLWARLAEGRRGARGYPGNASIHYILGLDFLASRQIDRAVSELTRAARENTEATEIFLILGNLLREKGQLERAIQIHQSILHRPGLSGSERAHALLCLGMDFKRAGFRNRAMDTFHEVVALEAKNAYALYHLMKIHEEEQDWDRAREAQEDLSQVTGTSDPSLEAFHLDQIGLAAARAGEPARAVRAFEEATRLAKKLPPPYLHHGDLLEQQGKLEEAESLWQRFAKANASDAHFVFERLERVRETLGRADRMERLYEQVIRDDEHDFRGRLALSRLRRAQGRSEEAFELVLEAVAQNPHALGVHIEAWNALGQETGDASGRVTRYLEQVSSSVLFVDPYVCIKCSYRANGVLWRCPHCQEWGSFIEERLETPER